MTTPDIEAIRKRAEAATEGPWHCKNKVGIVFGPECQIAYFGDFGDEELVRFNADRWIADAQFAAHARTDIPALISHIAAQDAAHKAEMLDFVVWVFRDEPVYHLDIGPEGVYAAYLAQKEKKDV